MGFREKCKKMDVYFKVEKELESTNTELETAKSELETTKSELETAKSELEETNKKISEKKSELESLKTEIMELKNFIDQKFESGEFKSKYRVNITDCYIIGLHGKKYITIRTFKRERIGNIYTFTSTGYPLIDIYNYRDVLNTDRNKDGKLKYKWLYTRDQAFGHLAPEKYIRYNNELDYEEHILDVYPELANFVDGMVPDAYLKKIYYEINDLSSKKLTKN